MAETLLGTGAELRLPRRAPDESEDPAAIDEKTNKAFVEVQVFAEIEDEGRRYRVGGTVGRGDAVSLADDPTTALLRIAEEAREEHLGELLGDLRIGGCDITPVRLLRSPVPHRVGGGSRGPPDGLMARTSASVGVP
jgi:hypothetical protein